MKREDAFYYKILLVSGFDDGYDKWLDGFLENEDPLSDIVLNLSFCRSDVNKTVSYLHSYCFEEEFNEEETCTKLRLFLKESFYSGRFNKKETVDLMHKFVLNRQGIYEFENNCWYDMYYFDYYYSLAEDGVLPWKNFDNAFFSYINDGIHVDYSLLWKEKESFLDKIKKIFKFG